MKKCETYQIIIESYIEGELTSADKTRLEEHVKDCPNCRKEYAEAQTLALVLNESFQPETSGEQVADSVMASISELPIHEKGQQPFLTFWKIAAGFMIAAGLCMSFYAGRSTTAWKSTHLTQTPYTISNLHGTVLVKHANSEIWQPLTSDSVIYTDDNFLSAPNSRVCFTLGDKSLIELKENSMLVLDITPDITNLHLVHGTLDADLVSPHGPFFVTTPHGRAEALGTEFTVQVD